MEPIKVLIVDDHSVVRRGLRAILESEQDIKVVGEAADGAEALEKVRELLPDVVLMDLVMPVVDGITAIRQIRESCPGTRVLVLTSFADDDKVFASIKAGAIGYLLKNSPAEDLERAIHSVARGELHLQAVIAEKVMDEFSPKPMETSNLAKLTERETEVLTMIARSMTNKEIAAELCISIKTVKVHVSSILNKLHSRDRTEAAVYAIQRGLLTDQESRQNNTP
jgi:two-component system, NarL family, response regulator LiaR